MVCVSELSLLGSSQVLVVCCRVAVFSLCLVVVQLSTLPQIEQIPTMCQEGYAATGALAFPSTIAGLTIPTVSTATSVAESTPSESA